MTGVCLHTGLGVEKDVSAAEEWYKAAAAAGYNKAQTSLGLIYHNGGTVYLLQIITNMLSILCIVRSIDVHAQLFCTVEMNFVILLLKIFSQVVRIR